MRKLEYQANKGSFIHWQLQDRRTKGILFIRGDVDNDNYLVTKLSCRYHCRRHSAPAHSKTSMQQRLKYVSGVVVIIFCEPTLRYSSFNGGDR